MGNAETTVSSITSTGAALNVVGVVAASSNPITTSIIIRPTVFITRPPHHITNYTSADSQVNP